MNTYHSSAKSVRWLRLCAVLGVILVALVAAGLAAAAHQRDHISGLVYIDANGNGAWDVGEEGYGGVYGVAIEDGDWVWRYRGTMVTFAPVGSGPDDPIVLESAPYRDMEDHEKDGNTCTRQDLSLVADDESYTPVRPCEGTFGMISYADDVTWEVTVEVPQGYVLTSPGTLTFRTGGYVPWLDFGIAPAEAG